MRPVHAVGAVCLGCGLLALPAFAGRIGSLLPDFSATALDGRAFSLAEAAETHKAVVILFLSTVCPYANYFAEHIRELDETYRPRGVLFIGVNSNQFETAEEMIEHARERGHTFPIIRDATAGIADQLGADRTPEAFLVDAEGRLRYHGWVQSKLRSPDLRRALDAVLAGKPVRLSETKAFGCAIDRRKRDRRPSASGAALGPD